MHQKMDVEVPMAPLIQPNELTIEVLSKVRESPQIRGWKSQITAATLIAVLIISGILVHVYVPDEECADSNATTNCEKQDPGALQVGLGLPMYFGVIVFVAELLRRFCLLVEEIFHLKTRYNGRLSRVFHQVFLANWKRTQLYVTAAVFVILLVILCIVDRSVWLEIRNNLDFALLFMAFYLLFVGLFRVNMSRIDMDTSLENLPLSPAEGIACGHFYGYLKLIFKDIPRDNNEVEGWESRIEKYESERGIEIDRRLFVLIPDSCDIFKGLDAYGLTPLKKTSSEEDDTMDVLVKRAGRTSRYEIVVCKLESTTGEGDRYVMVDVPRTLVTLKDMNDSDQLLYSLNEEQLASQAVNFKRALDKLIRDDREFIRKGYTTKIKTMCLKDTGEESTSWKKGQLAQLIRKRI